MSLSNPHTDTDRSNPPERTRSADPSESLLPSLASGRLEGMSIPDLLWNICCRHKTGVLHVTRGPITKKVYIQEGRIIFSASSDPNDRLGEMLLRDGVIRLDQLEQAIGRLHTGKRLGALLVEAGHLTPENLVRGVLSQVRGTVLSLFTWEEGEYHFHEGPLPTDEVVTLGMKTSELLLQGIRQISSFTRIRRSVGSIRTRYRRSTGWHEVIAGLPLSEGERMLLSRIGDEGESIDRLCTEVFLSNFEIYQALWALKVLGSIQDAETTPSANGQASLAGRVGSDGVIGLVVRLCRAGETGVLHMSRGPLERTLHIKEGHCIFATSNDHDDGLVAHLLRRGVISLRDREESSRRLLSNKRVGTILLEMGVIDDADLRAMVREQLSELVYDTFRWEDGDFAFATGELPTIEEITLEASIEDLVAAGVRRNTSWSRVLRGSGGLEAWLGLTRDYLAVLDRMTVGAQEWEVVSSLLAPKTVLEVCRASTLGDFRVCQILWALRLLGAVEELSAEAREAAIRQASAEPPPILVVDLPAESSFEVTRLDEMIPARADHTLTIKPSDWSEADRESAPVGPPMWSPSGGEPSLEVSETKGDPGEVISEIWRLAAERPPVVEEAPKTTEEVAPAPIPDVPEAYAAAPDVAEPVAATEQCSSPHAEPESSVSIDSPAEATQELSRDEVSSALGNEPEDQEHQEFELAEPGAGVEPDAFGFGRAAESSGEQSEPALELDLPPRPPLDVFPQAKSEDVSFAGEAHPVEEDSNRDREATEPPADDRSHDSEATVAIPRQVIEEALREPEAWPDSQELELPETPPQMPNEVAHSFAPLKDPSVEKASAEPYTEAVSDTAEVPSWTPPEDLDHRIARFNSKHKLVYRMIRSEVGAGAANFVQSCRRALLQGDLFGKAELKSDGTFEVEGLRSAVCEGKVSDPTADLERMIEREVESLRALAGEARVRSLVEQLRQI